MGTHKELVESTADYQYDVGRWSKECFGEELTIEAHERALRFGEEALELVQTQGVTAEQAHQLVDYVFGRPVGEAEQEVGGVMVTLGLLCWVAGINMGEQGEKELARVNLPEIMNKIRRKQVSKNLHGIGGTPEAAKLVAGS